MSGLEAVIESPTQGAANGFRLLVDFFQCEVAVIALVIGLGRPVKLGGLLVCGRRVAVDHSVAAGRDFSNIAVVEVDHLLGVSDEGGNIRCHQHLLVADAEHDRTAITRNHDLIGRL